MSKKPKDTPTVPKGGMLLTKDALSLLRNWSSFLGKDTILMWYRAIVFANGRARFFNGHSGVDLPLSLGDDKGQPLAVKADTLFGPLSSAGTDAVLVRTGDRLTISAGRFKGRLVVMAMDDAPSWPEEPDDWNDLDELGWVALQQVAFAADASGRKPEADGVLVRNQYMFATDGAIAATVPFKAGVDASEVVPSELISKLSAAKAVPDAFAFGKGKIWFRCGEVYVWSALPAGEFPMGLLGKVREMMGSAKPSASWTDAKAFASAVKRVGSFSSFAGIRLTAKPGEGILLQAECGTGDGEELVDAEVKKAFEINLHESYLYKLLDQGCTAMGVGENGVAVFGSPAKLTSLLLPIAPPQV